MGKATTNGEKGQLLKKYDLDSYHIQSHILSHPELSGLYHYPVSSSYGGCKLLCSNGHIDRSR